MLAPAWSTLLLVLRAQVPPATYLPSLLLVAALLHALVPSPAWPSAIIRGWLGLLQLVDSGWQFQLPIQHGPHFAIRLKHNIQDWCRIATLTQVLCYLHYPTLKC